LWLDALSDAVCRRLFSLDSELRMERCGCRCGRTADGCVARCTSDADHLGRSCSVSVSFRLVPESEWYKSSSSRRILTVRRTGLGPTAYQYSMSVIGVRPASSSMHMLAWPPAGATPLSMGAICANRALASQTWPRDESRESPYAPQFRSQRYLVYPRSCAKQRRFDPLYLHLFRAGLISSCHTSGCLVIEI